MPAQIVNANAALNGAQLYLINGAQNGFVSGMYGLPPTDKYGRVDNEAFVAQQHELLRRQYPGIVFPGENRSTASSHSR